ncbi:MAG: phosphatidylglycerophosphatase A [Pseudomonadota bacterium]
MRDLFLSFGGVGYLRPAPGTWGSLAALPVAWILHQVAGPLALGLAAVLLHFAGLNALKKHMENSEDHDPSWVVVDEVVGQWIALLPASAGAWWLDIDVMRLWPGVVAGFAFFRLFDIRKPWLVGRADRRDDAIGVMLDDVWAGVFAAVCVAALAAFAHLAVAI